MIVSFASICTMNTPMAYLPLSRYCHKDKALQQNNRGLARSDTKVEKKQKDTYLCSLYA